MFKSTKNSIVWSVGVLAVLAFVILTAPKYSLAQYQSNEDGYAHLDYPANPSPFLTSLSQSPNSTTVIIKGYGFISTSVVRVNGSSYPSSFIDSSHILINLSPNVLNQDVLYISVMNEGPGGGYSNALSLKPTATIVSTTSNTYTNSYSNTNQYTTSKNTTDSENDSTGKDAKSLAANAIFGVNTFLPSGLIQWVLLGIIISLLVLVVRRLMGLTDAYHATPLKHD